MQKAPRTRWWLAAAAVLAVGVVLGWLLARRLESPEQLAARAQPPAASWVTAPVEQRVLSATVITRGDVAPQELVAAGAPASVEGTPIVTGLPRATGDVVAEGDTVIEISGRPVFAVQGDVPAYRGLRPGMSGPDVAQLQAALGRLGCPVPDEPGVFGEGTKLCVATWYADAGFAAVPGSPTEAADIAAAEQAVAEAESAVTAAGATFDAISAGPASSEVLAARVALSAARRGVDDATASAATADATAAAALAAAREELARVGADPASAPSDIATAQLAVTAAEGAANDAARNGRSQVAAAREAVSLAEAALDDVTASPDLTRELEGLDAASAARDRAVVALATLRAVSGPTVPLGEVVFVSSFPARLQYAPARLGPLQAGDAATGSTSGAAVEISSGELAVSVRVGAGERDLVRVGMPVELLDELANVPYPATITAVDDVATPGPDGSLGYAMVVTPADALPASLTGANVRVTITAASSDGEVLVVPVAAVSSKADGTTVVGVLPEGAQPDAEPTEVPVRTALAADGFVAVTPTVPDALRAGDRVVVGR